MYVHSFGWYLNLQYTVLLTDTPTNYAIEAQWAKSNKSNKEPHNRTLIVMYTTSAVLYILDDPTGQGR